MFFPRSSSGSGLPHARNFSEVFRATPSVFSSCDFSSFGKAGSAEFGFFKLCGFWKELSGDAGKIAILGRLGLWPNVRRYAGAITEGRRV